MRSVGVEEELLLVDARSGAPLAVSGAVLAAADRSAWQRPGAIGLPDHEFEKELQKEQLEFATKPVTEMGELQQEIVRIRGGAARHAASAGAVVAAVATSPLPVQPSLNVGPRYRWMGEQFGLTAQEQLTCGCHVHVSVASDEEGVAVLDRIRPWLAVLTALSANSPFWQGEDSGYGSYRSRVWNRWPSAGPVEVFGSADRYHERVRTMIDTGVLRDEGMIYFDARLSATYPTVEVRVADVCLDAATPVLLAALSRGLVETAARAWQDGQPPARIGTSLLRLASWRAGRSGLDGPLLHPVTMRETSAEQAVEALYQHVREALNDHGDDERVREAIAHLYERGNGARIQRGLHAEGQTLAAIVTRCAEMTVGP
ncbi:MULTISPECIES: glutamate--cysteine ligase [Streptomyces]|uniref:glutamate--cysteine ligase n=1 Tax=Streptomyces TaxID=1883 RepID=UPI00017EA2FF|nr:MULTISPECIES: glutamate--cysteine ligase [Streptomyces]AKL64544.1 carboxylate--amine ligase [Streptomyces sp. Mg1]EDX20703.1 carboxylate-amine ligase [Streptomyces sp. Mg1]RPK42541.1 Carboxylate-amine ligase YbdK [Streptomyces sp. ADI91-18]WSR97089.1 glutamate--cysteine ligase [Streptomyces goshikiensis]